MRTLQCALMGGAVRLSLAETALLTSGKSLTKHFLDFEEENQ